MGKGEKASSEVEVREQLEQVGVVSRRSRGHWHGHGHGALSDGPWQTATILPERAAVTMQKMYPAPETKRKAKCRGAGDLRCRCGYT